MNNTKDKSVENKISSTTNNSVQPEERRNIINHQTRINQYINQSNNIIHQGYIDNVKMSENTRILSINPNGINPWDDIQNNMINQSFQQKQIDIALFNETNMKWTPTNLDKIEYEFKKNNREVKVIGCDSKKWDLTTNNYLPGGLLTVVQGKCRALLQDETIHKSNLGNWMAIQLTHNNKTLVIINLYRIPISSSKGPRCCLTQYNLSEGKVKNSNKYRKEILSQIEEYVNSNNIDEIIIAGDYNQQISSNEIKQFYNKIGVRDVHSVVNNIELNDMDKTYINGRFQIDSIAASNGIMNYIEGCQVVDNNEIIHTDHRGYVIDVNLQEYFDDNFSTWDHINRVMLNPSRRSHKEKFTEIIDEQMNIYDLDDKLEELQQNPLHEHIEIIDETITKIFNIARRKIEGMKRGIPYTTEKARIKDTISIWKTIIREKKNKPIDKDKLQSKISRWNIVIDDDETIETAIEKLDTAKVEWNKMKSQRKEYREQYLLDHHHSKINEEHQNSQKMKKKVIKNIEKQQKRNHTFRYLTKHAGKGVKGNLKRLHIVNENDQIIRTIIDKENIEKTIKEFNEKHFQKAHQSIAYKDKIYAELDRDDIRNKILRGQLEREQCSSEEVWEFLRLLKTPTRQQERIRSDKITKEEWIEKVKKAKKTSASSIFSQRTYAIYKCALESERMSENLIKFYNIIITKGYYPKRWKNITDVILEKGKGPKLGKLRTITLIEADLQLLMRIFLDATKQELIENDSRFSTANYGSRKNFSIETALLEKRLILDHSVLETKQIIYNFTDLQSCYDRQLSKIGSIVEEAAGRNRKAMYLFTKIMPNFEHYINTGYGISTISYGGEECQLAGTGQGNKFSGDMCRDISSLIIKQIENENLGIIFQSPVKEVQEQSVSVSFVDDTDFIAEGHQYQQKMQQIINIYQKYYTATGGKIEGSKTKFFAWKWKWQQGQKVIHQINAEIYADEQKIKQMSNEESIKTLGVHITPSLQWKCQFQQMMTKLQDTISKLKYTPMNTHNAYLYFNMYMITKVYFGCGIITLSEQQEKTIMKAYEATMLNKLGLSQKFPKELIYSRREALGVGLLKPSTIIAILATKQYFGHKRMRGRISNIININEEKAALEYGYSSNITEISTKYKRKRTIWNDEVGEMLMKRKITIQNEKSIIKTITNNKTIMDYAKEYVQETNKDENILAIINHVRIYQKMLIPCELVGMQGNQQTREMTNSNTTSCIRWNFKFPKMPRPSKKSIQIWKQYTEWLKTKQISTMYDFEHAVTFRYSITDDLNTIKENNEEQIQYYQKVTEGNNNNRYKQVQYQPNEQEQFHNIIAEMKPSGRTIISDIIRRSQWPITTTQETSNPFNQQITEAIENGEMLAATDASCKNNSMTGHWMLITTRQTNLTERTIYHKQWHPNTIVGAETITLLELVEVINKKCKHISRGKIRIGVDNRKAYNSITNQMMKSTQYTQDAGAEITRIKQIIEESHIEIQLILIKHSKKITAPFHQKPIEYLINKCHQKANQAHQRIHQNENITNIKFQGTYGIKIKEQISTNSIKEAIRICDGIEEEERYGRRKLTYSYDMIDREARTSIPKNKMSNSMMKCVHGYNHYGLRNSIINRNSTEETCPRCSQVESWDHIVRCEKTAQFRKDFITNLATEMIKEKQNDVSPEEIFSMIEDILIFMEGGSEEEYETNQHMVGMANLFRGYPVKVWTGVNFQQIKYRKLNKILTKHCIFYYMKCWADRNEHYHDEVKQKERTLQWKRNLERHVNENESTNIRLVMERMRIDEQRSSSKTILKWIYSVNDAIKKVKERPKNDIRRYFEI